MRIKIYGAMGGVPIHMPGKSAYGINSTCFGLIYEDDLLVLDAGTGIALLNNEPDIEHLDVVLGHLHFDHLIGLPRLNRLFQKNSITFHTISRSDQTLEEQILGPFKPPYWPVPLANCPVLTNELFVGKTSIVSGFNVTPFLAEHPDDTTSFVITRDNKKIVYMLDNEIQLMSSDKYEKLVEYCKDADLLIYDSAYTSEDYIGKEGFGHGTVTEGKKLYTDSNSKCIIFAHFDALYTDEKIDSMKQELTGINYIFAEDGLELEI